MSISQIFHKGDFTMHGKIIHILILAFSLATSATVQTFAQTHILRVDIENGSTSGDGQGWDSDAIKFLQDALSAADDWLGLPGNEFGTVQIWVAQGVYRPAEDSSTPSCPTAQEPCDQDTSFMLRNRVELYGGFGGWEQSIDERVDWLTQPSVLDGDLLANDVVTIEYQPDGYGWVSDISVLVGMFDTYADNTFHVVQAIGVNRSAILDGFTVRGGMAIIDSFIAMRNCTVTANAHGVPALHIAGNSEPRICQCTFDSSHGRTVIIEGGAQPVFIDCTIDGEFCNLRTAADFGPPHAAAAVPGLMLARFLQARLDLISSLKGSKPLESRITMLYSGNRHFTPSCEGEQMNGKFTRASGH
jgi:hypothetical protein